jgi:aminoglycoside phosphotransferase (APT) family kinase protein
MSTAERPSAAEASRLMRRLDWRFLLPDPGLRRVMYVGSRSNTLARSLAAFSESITFADEDSTPGGEVDLVVAQGATRRQVEAVLPRLAPAGWLYWERGSGLALRANDRHWLDRAGLSQIQAFWHCAGFEECRWIVPLEEPSALAMLLKRRFSGVAPDRLVQIARVITRSLTFRRMLATSVIACRGAGRECATFAQRFIETHGGAPSGLPGSTRAFIMATPRFASSRSVVFLMAPDAECEPTLVAKIARAEADGDALACEARNLRDLQLAHQRIDAPTLTAHAVFERRAVLVESAVHGQLMQPSLVRSRPGECIEAVTQWLEEFHRATRAPAAHLPGRLMGRLHAQFKRLESVVARVPSAPQLLLRVRHETSRLECLNLPLVFEHGDLSSPNLLMLGNGRVGVLDWELSDPRGLPAVDLFFFLAFVAFARERATSPEQCVSAFRNAFFVKNAWTRPYIARYASTMGVPVAALTPLFLLCWSRYLANLPDRMAWAVGRDLRQDEWQEVRRDRYWHLWKFAAENMNDLQFAL